MSIDPHNNFGWERGLNKTKLNKQTTLNKPFLNRIQSQEAGNGDGAENVFLFILSIFERLFTSHKWNFEI